MTPEDDAALDGGEQTPALAPVPAISEAPPPTNVKGTVRQAYEQAQAKAAERDERERAPRPPQGVEERVEGSNEGKPALDRTRDPHGRFARGEVNERDHQETKAALEALDAAPEAPQQPPEGVVLRPPPGWSAAARAQFGLLPPEVKEAVAKREADVATGMQVLQRYKGLETYTPAIEASGISHAEFTKRAVEWEQSLRTNPIGTLLHVARLGNVDIVRLAQQIQQQGGQQPQQRSPAQQAVAQTYQQVRQQAPQPQQDFRAIIRQEFAEREAHGAVDEFLSDPKNIHAEAVADDMALLITNGRADDLEQAYEMACWARPEIRALLIRQAGANPGSTSEADRARRTASEARSAAKATVGAPSGPRPEKKDDRPPNAPVRYDVRKAYQQVLDRQT